LKIGIRFTQLLFLLLAPLSAAYAQDNETVIRPLQLSVFGGGGGTLIGANTPGSGEGRNLNITAGANLGFGNLTYHGFLPAIEIRGTYPFYDGHYFSEENFLGGLKVEKPYHSLHPYVDVLFGRGELTYVGKGALNPAKTILYQKSNSNVLGAGIGFDYDVLTSFAFKADLQLNHYSDVPVTTSGSANSTAFIIGVVYRFGYNDRHAY
jgi:hypothetical protein